MTEENFNTAYEMTKRIYFWRTIVEGIEAGSVDGLLNEQADLTREIGCDDETNILLRNQFKHQCLLFSKKVLAILEEDFKRF
jgi:hypothetical protein